MYTGRPFIKLFEDISCTKELNVDLFDCYVTTVKVINSISDIVLKRNIYVKNVGTHKAYNVRITAMSDDSDIESGFDHETIIPLEHKTIIPLEVVAFKLSIPIVKGQTMDRTLSYKIDYDTIP